MAIGERIRFFRMLRGMTQKYLGMTVGINEKTADIRIAQYESGKRTPKPQMVQDLAMVLEVSPVALETPDIKYSEVAMQTLFAMEDKYGLNVEQSEGRAMIYLDLKDAPDKAMHSHLTKWAKKAAELKAGEISKEEYDNWRYRFPYSDADETSQKLRELRKKHKSE